MKKDHRKEYNVRIMYSGIDKASVMAYTATEAEAIARAEFVWDSNANIDDIEVNEA